MPGRTSNVKSTKFRRGAPQVTKWAHRPFTNSSRRDLLELRHWVRASAEQPDYPFTRFNRRIEVVKYTDEEYDKLLTPPPGASSTDQDKRWPRRHTDHLFDLCRRYDLRWAVIHDRFDHRPQHSLEDMKLRFYTVMARIIRFRSDRQNYPLKSQYTDFAYNAQSDMKRRKQADRAFRRNQDQVSEERSLLQEIRAIDALMAEIATRGFEGADAAVLALARRSNPRAPAPLDVLLAQREQASAEESGAGSGSGSAPMESSHSASGAENGGPIGPSGLSLSVFAPNSGAAAGAVVLPGTTGVVGGTMTAGGTPLATSGSGTPSTPSAAAAASGSGSNAVTSAEGEPTIRKTVPPAGQGGPRGGTKAWTGKASAVPVDPFFGLSLRSEQMLSVVSTACNAPQCNASQCNAPHHILQ